MCFNYGITTAVYFKTVTGDEDEDVDLAAPKIYEPVESYDQLSDRFKMFQAQYNEVIRGSQMDLVFFRVNLLLYPL